MFGPLVSAEGDEREQAEQGRGGAPDGEIRPLALRLHAEVAPRLLERLMNDN